MNSVILLYQNPDGNIKLDVRLENETVWLTQAQMATLFGKDKRTISEYRTNIYNDGELGKFQLSGNSGQFNLKAIEKSNVNLITTI
jgi:hypothetical protein